MSGFRIGCLLCDAQVKFKLGAAAQSWLRTQFRISSKSLLRRGTTKLLLLPVLWPFNRATLLVAVAMQLTLDVAPLLITVIGCLLSFAARGTANRDKAGSASAPLSKARKRLESEPWDCFQAVRLNRSSLCLDCWSGSRRFRPQSLVGPLFVLPSLFFLLTSTSRLVELRVLTGDRSPRSVVRSCRPPLI